MAHSSTISMQSGATTITLNGPDGSTDVDLQAMFVSDLSSGHTRWTYKTTNRRVYQWTLRLESLTTQQRLDLENFWLLVGGPAGTFTYTHTDGAVYTARFIDTDLRFVRKQNEHSVQIRLEVAEHPIDGSAITTTSTTTGAGTTTAP